MNIRQAKYIATIYECGSISAAAKKLYLSQPALSQTIQIVEKEIGTKIFNRSTTPISLTYAGRKYMEAVYKFMDLENNLARQLQEIRQEEAGRLRLGISALRGAAFLPQILPEFLLRYPLVEIELVETGSAHMDEMLTQGKVDLALVIAVAEHYPDIEYITLCRERMVLYAGNNTALAKRIPSHTEIDITEAMEETFISVKQGHGVRAMQDYMFFENNISPKVFLETESVVLARNLANACNMVTLYPETLTAGSSPFSTSDAEFCYPIAGERYTRAFYLCYNRAAFQPKYMRDMIDIIKSITFNTIPGIAIKEEK